MVKKNIAKEHIVILDSLSMFPEGVGIDELEVSLKTPLHKRTLLRRLSTLIKGNQVKKIGKGRAVKYQLLIIKNAPSSELAPPPELKEKESLLNLAEASQKLVKIITQPLHTRRHVGYNREFLDSYRANHTRYLLEEISSKLYALGESPEGELPPGTYARQIYNRLLIDLSWNSSRLEGNTYSLLETERLLELSEKAQGKDLKETQMILNHKEAIEFLVEGNSFIGVNRFTILNLHALLSNNLLSSIEACGRLRTIPVGIGKSTYNPPAVPQVVQECVQQIVDTANAILDPFEQAFFLMVHIPYLQPFEDVNKRVSRLSANIPFIQKNLCPMSFVDVPEETYINGLLAVYELNRTELLADVFVWAYERSCALYSLKRKELGEPDPFRLRLSSLIKETVADIVRARFDKKNAVTAIKQKASIFLQGEDQERFQEVVENELRGLHEGNIARYKLRPSEYENWQKTWK